MDYLIGLDDAKNIAEKSFSKEHKAMQEAFDKMSPKMQKKMIKMFYSFIEDEED